MKNVMRYLKKAAFGAGITLLALLVGPNLPGCHEGRHMDYYGPHRDIQYSGHGHAMATPHLMYPARFAFRPPPPAPPAVCYRGHQVGQSHHDGHWK